ncbi:unnamed protein product [Heligmosomoides polygyrus]|uniref:GLTP domain-containing protein n=1 Tax=Heligmosomoides polygyrus TaxID=6339 RepID=A0A183FWW9_HELPZ|nr:unnamed protein product [Heligmosomoides polygyrus]
MGKEVLELGRENDCGNNIWGYQTFNGLPAAKRLAPVVGWVIITSAERTALLIAKRLVSLCESTLIGSAGTFEVPVKETNVVAKWMALARILITLLSTEIFLAGSLHSKEEQTAKREFYELNTAKLHVYWHNALIRSLIKAHCRNLLTQLPYVERVVYELCTNNATTTVALAKCAVQVFNARDFARDRYGEQIHLLSKVRRGRRFLSTARIRSSPKRLRSKQKRPIIKRLFIGYVGEENPEKPQPTSP